MATRSRVMSCASSDEASQWTRSTCGLCSLGCGLEIASRGGRIVGVRGRADHPVGRGRLGPKGLHQWQANHHPDRGTTPLIRNRSGKMKRATWDEALALAAGKLEESIAAHGPTAIAFYNSGQLLLEEYYALAKIARGGLGTPNIDANTRLCTATTGESLMATFGADGPPGAFADLDVAECIVLFGHNAAEQSTVLWMRILAAKDGPTPPRVIVIDPRRTATVVHGADLHLAPRPGTNVAVINGLCQQLLERGLVDRAFIEKHTVGFERFQAVVAPYTPERVEELTGIPAADLRRAAEWIGTSKTTVTTCLQGVYQSHQASATACTVNSMHLLMGKIGKPGCAPFQFAGQPSSMNTRECGADGSYPGYRNWEDPAHMKDLAKRWNVPVERLGQKPVSAPEIFEMCHDGHVRVMWIVGTNPAVSMTNRAWTHAALRRPFLVVQDPFATAETVAFADVYLPSAMWGEKHGTMTNAERRCNYVAKVVEPPGEARSDLDVFVALARRLGLADRDGAPLLAFTDPEGAFDEWRRVSKGTIPDYSGMTYEKLRERGGIQWPCDRKRPDGTERLYVEPIFPNETAIAEGFLKDLRTGHGHTPREYAKSHATSRARLIAVDWEPPLEAPDADRPLSAISGRQAYHWHTRTKTGRIAWLAAAAGSCFVAMHPADARERALEDGARVRVSSARGDVVALLRISDAMPRGTIFVPFHHGELDRDEEPNALMASTWDPLSKQPLQKSARVRVERAKEAT